MAERIQKILAASGMVSRRKAEAWITAGRVQVNGKTAQLGDTADAQLDQITVDGAPISREPEKLYLMLHKPRGYITTLSDERGRKTVQDLLQGCPSRVYPVGRLDQYSEGLLLLTNDGALAHRLMHPAGEVDKTYLVWVSGYTPAALEKLHRPILLDGRPICEPTVRLLWSRGQEAQLCMTIHEGRNRQIRRMCEAAGLHANRLKRIREGRLELGELPCGQWRYLTEQELALLQE